MQHATAVGSVWLCAILMVSAMPARSAAASWKPEKAIEIVAPSGPGGTTDRTARVLARIMTQHKLVDVPVNVVNKPGGNGIIGLTYIDQHPGDQCGRLPECFEQRPTAERLGTAEPAL